MAAVLIFTVIFTLQNKDIQLQSSPLNNITLEAREKNIKIKGSHDNLLKEHLMSAQNVVKTYQGTQPDGAIHLDESGRVIIDKDMKRLFDYYLSAMGELPLDQMRKYLAKFAGKQLNPEQLEQMLTYFDQYQYYLTQAAVFSQTIEKDTNLQEKMNLLSEFRVDKLGLTMANAFFADEQAYIEYVMSDKNNTEPVDQQQNWLQAENQATEFQDVVIENREFNQMNRLDSPDVYQYRLEKYGKDAAIRLTQLDQQRAQWQTVVANYFNQRQQIENHQGTLSITQLNSNYSTQEVRRLEALWRNNSHSFNK